MEIEDAGVVKRGSGDDTVAVGVGVVGVEGVAGLAGTGGGVEITFSGLGKWDLCLCSCFACKTVDSLLSVLTELLQSLAQQRHDKSPFTYALVSRNLKPFKTRYVLPADFISFKVIFAPI